ncbi:hypothetical protein BT96DRAFT_1081670 [Gymnopus androsaceus JB14]|uniref:Protein kinase domain-containing protein n=1 Tax=Gymnopus androsaceus JB14 TaxID=1447944 RepID=A0A6A4GMP9_9AGAR|nr:hypothetical protein BT96DRAFT_1081670 [Gymnopus androsaceus JB14]
MNDPIHDNTHSSEGCHFWKEFSPTDPGFDPKMLLSHFMKTGTDLPKENFVKALVIPVEDLPKTTFRYSPTYEEVNGLIMLQHVMLTLNITGCYLPIFWVSNQKDTPKQWEGECYLVYEDNAHIYYHCLTYMPPNLVCKMLLNAADPRVHQFTISQQAQMGRLWEQFSDIAIIQYESPRCILVQSEDGHATKKQKMDGSIGLLELSSSSLVTNVEESGHVCHCYICKTLGRLGKQEIEIYWCLQEYDIHQPPLRGIMHFIPEWSTGCWSAGKDLQLPCLISVGNELKKAETHMDIKPNNFVLDVGPHAQPMLKIIDFNLSFMDANSKIACGVCGTKGYMAPEVQEGK